MESIIIEIEKYVKMYKRGMLFISECLEYIQKIIYQYCATIDDIDIRLETEAHLYRIALYKLHKEICKQERHIIEDRRKYNA